MLQLALVMFVLALVAAILGFGGLAGSLMGIAKLFFVIFLVLFIVSAIFAALQGRAPM